MDSYSMILTFSGNHIIKWSVQRRILVILNLMLIANV